MLLSLNKKHRGRCRPFGRSPAGKQFADGIEDEITSRNDRHRRKNTEYTSCLSRFTLVLAANDSALL